MLGMGGDDAMTPTDPALREPRTTTARQIIAHREWWEWLPEAYQMSRVRLNDVLVDIEDEAVALAAAAEAAPLDARQLMDAFDGIVGEHWPIETWKAVIAEYAALRSPDTETAGEAGS